MKLKTKSKRDYEDDGLLPLVNIIFLLLIFFMIVGVIEKNILKDNIELPKVTLDRFENKDVAKIFYDENKNIYLNDMLINIKDLRQSIKTNKVKIDNSNDINSNIVEQLKQLNSLYKSGILTKEEFEKAKKKILN